MSDRVENFDKVRTIMYGENHERFNEILTLLSDPNLTTDDIPPSVCAEDISYVLRLKNVKTRPGCRMELLRAICIGSDAIIGETIYGEHTDFYTTACKRLKRYLKLNGVKSHGTVNEYKSYRKTPELVKLIGQFTESI